MDAIEFDELLEVTAGIVLFGNPIIEIFDPTAVELSLDTVTGLPYSVVLAPITIGTAIVCVFPALSVNGASPVVVVIPSTMSKLWDGRLRLPTLAEEGMGVPLAEQAASKRVRRAEGSREEEPQLMEMQMVVEGRKEVLVPARVQIPDVVRAVREFWGFVNGEKDVHGRGSW